MTARALTFALLSFSFATNSWGADTPPTESSQGGTSPESEQVPGSARDTGEATTADSEESAPAGVEQREIDWKGPLKLYDLGQVDEALEGLRAQVIDCGEPEEGKCTRAQLATLYASTAVVLAGSGDHSWCLASAKPVFFQTASLPFPCCVRQVL